MNFKILNEDEVANIYNNYLLKDFPPNEVKGLNKIIRNTKKDNYVSYGIYKNDEFVGYAYFVKNNKTIMLDYFAIIKDKRASGLGSEVLKRFIDEFKTKYSTFLLESEDPLFAVNSSDKIIREKRIEFYEKNGCEKINFKSKVYGVNYVLFTLFNYDDTNILEQYKDIYISMSDLEKFKQNIVILK